MDLISRLEDKSKPPLVIAEVADAHYGSIDRAKRMVSRAKEAGAEVVKFQHHLPSHEMLREIPSSKNMNEPLYDFLEKNALTIAQHRELSDFCESQGITYLCTPFSWQAAIELETQLAPDFYKIGSGEMLDFPSLAKIAGFGKPLIVSTGMSSTAEVRSAYNFLAPRCAGLVLMNCTSAYPPVAADIHLSFITEMKHMFPDAVIGHSDHFPSINLSIAAAALGARILERHVTDDPSLSGPDQAVSSTFEELAALVSAIADVHEALYAQKRLHDSEREIRDWAHRSLVYVRAMDAGEVVGPDDVWGKRPGTGIPSRFMEHVIGRKLVKSVGKDELVNFSDLVLN